MSRKRTITIVVLIATTSLLMGLYFNKRHATEEVYDPQLDLVIKDYLPENIISPSSGGKVFCAYDWLGSDTKNDKTYVYAWVVCSEYYLTEGKIEEGTGTSLPVVLVTVKSNSGYQINELKKPNDGTYYAQSIKNIFPKRIREKILNTNSDEYNKRVDILSSQVLLQAKNYFSGSTSDL